MHFISGDDGDVIYAMASLRMIGGVDLRLTPSSGLVRSVYTPEKAENLAVLLRTQQYIKSCRYCTREERDAVGGVNVDGFRRAYKGGPNIKDWISDYLGLGQVVEEPWLAVPDPVHVADIIMHRSPRYHTGSFPWWDVPGGFSGRIAMVGGVEEHRDFCTRYGWVPHHPTDGFLGLARVIAGCKLFVGNQSAPMAVALGLGVAVVQEVDLSTPNCRLWSRSNAQYVSDGKVTW